VLKGFYKGRIHFKRAFVENDKEAHENGLESEWSTSTEEFFRLGEMLSVRCYTYISYAGAAHQNQYITTLDFFGKGAGSLEIQQLLGYLFENARRVIEYCEKVILAEFEGEIDEESFSRATKKPRTSSGSCWGNLALTGEG